MVRTGSLLLQRDLLRVLWGGGKKKKIDAAMRPGDLLSADRRVLPPAGRRSRGDTLAGRPLRGGRRRDGAAPRRRGSRRGSAAADADPPRARAADRGLLHLGLVRRQGDVPRARRPRPRLSRRPLPRSGDLRVPLRAARESQKPRPRRLPPGQPLRRRRRGPRLRLAVRLPRERGLRLRLLRRPRSRHRREAQKGARPPPTLRQRTKQTLRRRRLLRHRPPGRRPPGPRLLRHRRRHRHRPRPTPQRHQPPRRSRLRLGRPQRPPSGRRRRRWWITRLIFRRDAADEGNEGRNALLLLWFLCDLFFFIYLPVVVALFRFSWIKYRISSVYLREKKSGGRSVRPSVYTGVYPRTDDE
mmetsp:Transcript_566/g.2008  ORF Transcript_566/g.2008 Transcript_566/m.2008 type:complete len:356 (-) Transcript_566:52-1119(-)